MAFDENRARVMRAAGAASVAAPYVRRIMSDDELRNDLRTLIVAGRHLYEGLTANGVSKLLEDDVRKDLDRIVASLQGASERVIRPQRSSHWGSWIIGGTLIGGAVAGLLIYPGTRKQILRAVGMSDGDPWIDAASDNGGGAEARAEAEMTA
jgi:hypothetical protein